MKNRKYNIISNLVVIMLYISFFIIIGFLASDSQKTQAKLFIQQALQGNFNFSITQQSPSLAIKNFALPLYEKEHLKTEFQLTTKELFIQNVNPLISSDSSSAKQLRLSSCNQREKIEFKQKQFYKWKDSDNNLHVSDRIPKNKDYHDLVIRKLKTANFFTLNLDSDYSQLPAFASDRMKRDVNQIYKILINNVGISQLNPINLNLKLFDDKDQFNAYKNKVAPKLGTAGGFFISSINEATVYTGRNDQRMFAVTRHEATHAIINGAFGRIPLWLNEGLAEYFERLTFHNGMARIVALNQHHLHLIEKNTPPNLFNYLNLTGTQWYEESKKSMHYALGWSIVYFMMSSKPDMQFLSYMLDHLAINYCQPFSDIDYINQHYAGGLPQFEKNWKQWLARTNKIEHRY